MLTQEELQLLTQIIDFYLLFQSFDYPHRKHENDVMQLRNKLAEMVQK